jgi:cytochrome c biogenesis protein CcmG/thiol:disulfide interchange protein DsbE
MTNATKVKQRRNGTKAQRDRRPARRTASSTWIAIAVVFAVVIVAAVFLSGGTEDDGFAPSAPGTVSIDRESGPMLAAGESVPGFEAPALDGGAPIVWDDVAGRLTVLSIWAPWCPHCQAELPRLAAAVGARPGVQLVTITTAYGAQPGPTPPEYMADEGLSFPVAVDDEAQTLLRGFGVESFPTTYYVASDGTVVTSTTGEVPAEQLEAILDDLEQR